MANKYFVIILDENVMEEFDNKTDTNNYITELLSNTEENEIIVVYGEELEFDIKAFIKKETN